MAVNWSGIWQGINELGNTKRGMIQNAKGPGANFAESFGRAREQKDAREFQAVEAQKGRDFTAGETREGRRYEGLQKFLDRNLTRDLAGMDDVARRDIAKQAQTHTQTLQTELMQFNATELDRRLTHAETLEKERTERMLAEFQEASRRFDLEFGQRQEGIDQAGQPDYQTALSAALLPFSQKGDYDAVSNMWTEGILPLSVGTVDTLRQGFNSQFKDGKPPQPMLDAFESYIAGLGAAQMPSDEMFRGGADQPTPDVARGGAEITSQAKDIMDGLSKLKESAIGQGMKDDIQDDMDDMQQIHGVLGFTPGLLQTYKDKLAKYQALLEALAEPQMAPRNRGGVSGSF